MSARLRPRRLTLTPTQERWVFWALLATGLVVRAVRLDQPIVENYVGRQIPTAMVARNLDRGGSVLYPQLDTEPRPNYFLVEAPIYELIAVELHRQTRLALEPAGRLLSALCTILGAWGLFGLARRREGPGTALLAMAAFLALPVTIRYGRAFQPDALAVGASIAALRLWDDAEDRPSVVRALIAWLLLATALLAKVTVAFVIVPLVVVIQTRRHWLLKLAAIGLAFMPAACWYAHAASLLRASTSASGAGQTAIAWVQALMPNAWLHRATWTAIVQFLIVRAFTPLGFALAIWGLTRRSALVPPQSGIAGLAEGMVPSSWLWRVWSCSALAALAVLAGKLHHEYYWLALAPVAAVGAARGIRDVATWGPQGRPLAVLVTAAFITLGFLQAASTWRTPREWAHIQEVGRVVQSKTPINARLIAPEALLYYGDRKGHRLEISPSAALRAGRELGYDLEPEARALRIEPAVALLRIEGRAGSYFADVAGGFAGPRRKALHDAVRDPAQFGWPILIDQPELMLLAGPATPPRPMIESEDVLDISR